MRIAINALASGAGGLRTYLENFLPALASASGTHRTVVYVQTDDIPALGFAHPRVDFRGVDGIGAHGLKRSAWQQTVLPRLLRADRADVLYEPANIGCWFAPCPVVLAIRTTWFFDEQVSSRMRLEQARIRLVRRILRLSARRAAALITNSRFAKAGVAASAGMSPDKITVVYHGRSEQFYPRPEAEQRAFRDRIGIARPYILSVSNFYEHKNFPRLVEAYSALVGELSDPPRLVVAGAPYDTGAYSQTLATIRDAGIGDRVQLLGPIAHRDLPLLYSGAEFFVYPSLTEAFGHPLVEAMSCGTPIAASRVSAIPEVCGDAALLFEPTDPSAIATAMRLMLADRSLRQRFAAAGRERAATFSWERSARETLAVLESCAGTSAAGIEGRSDREMAG